MAVLKSEIIYLSFEQITCKEVFAVNAFVILETPVITDKNNIVLVLVNWHVPNVDRLPIAATYLLN